MLDTQQIDGNTLSEFEGTSEKDHVSWRENQGNFCTGYIQGAKKGIQFINQQNLSSLISLVKRIWGHYVC
jgi:hypothetical protein